MYFEITPVCPITGFAGNTIRSFPVLVTYESGESSTSNFVFRSVVGKENFPDVSFSDTENHWGKEYIQTLAKCGAVNGKKKNIFKPDDGITRAEFSKILSVAFSVNTTTDLPLFEDVRSTDWYYNHVNSLYISGIINGTSDTKFSPSKTISREEAVVMIIRLYEKATKTAVFTENHKYPDESQISSWAISAVNKATALNIIEGTSKGNFAPKRTLTRAEASALIVRLAELLS